MDKPLFCKIGILALLITASTCLAATPSSYYDQTYAQLRTSAIAHLTSEGKTGQSYAVGVAPELTRIFREGGPALDWNGTITMSLARGESGYRQLAIVPVVLGSGLTDVSLSATAMTNASLGLPIEVNVGPMLYVNTDSVTVTANYDVPDAMAFGRSGFNVDPNSLQSVVIGVTVDENTAAGTYTGQITIEPAGEDAEVLDVEITVYDFDLPYGPAMKTQFSSGMTSMMRDYRVESSWWDPPFSDLSSLGAQEWADAAASVEAFFAIPGNNFMIIRTPGAPLNGGIIGGSGDDLTNFNSYSAGDIQAMKDYWAGMATILDAQGRMDQAALYVWDEPGSTGITKVDDVCTWVHDADSRLKTLCTDNSNNVRALRLSGHVNIHVAETNVFNPTLDAVANWGTGNEVWVYVCYLPQAPWPNLMSDNTCLDNRVIPWQIYQHQLTGMLYWDTQLSFWNELNDSDWPGTNAGSMENAGDGTLIHNSGSWYPSQRLANLADGMEDYLYIQELASLMERSDPCNPGVPNTTAWQNARAAGQAALDQVVDVAGTTLSGETTSNSVLLDARSDIADAIVTLSGLLGPEVCGGSGQQYYGADISGPDGVSDCEVNMYDFMELASQWTDCTDPCDPCGITGMDALNERYQ
ncbi:MAG: DUF4091 domain-containing protein [Sedimentisphaerales bacterium]|nr:DUF4091 domain-containing protein [Sedimentisphaerales bacterium]